MSPPHNDAELENLLTFLQRSRGFNLDSYKRPTLMRQMTKRLQQVGVEGFTDYVDYLEVHPDEFGHLFNAILINVTSFFRDEAAWDYLKSEIIPRLLAAKQPNAAIRVWSAGVASGQEAYSVAMLLAEALGDAPFRQRVKIYATDVDEEALNLARTASYDEKQIADVPEPLRAKYFERSSTHYVFRKDLRRSIIFGRHDLLQDAPISRVDLLICRNTLMYFNAEAQTRILAHFHYALTDTGFLFLGKSEMLLTHTNLFTPVDMKLRVFAKVSRGSLRERLITLGQGNNHEEGAAQLVNHVRLRELALDVALVAQVVFDASGLLALINQAARTLFGLGSNDLGRPLQDLEVSYRPAELRSLIDRATLEHRPILQRDVDWLVNGELHYFDVHVTSLFSTSGDRLGTSIAFADVTRHRRLQDELQRSRQDLETAYEELQATNEELETTNEELQSTNEELETTNEELQSTNEELETMNEELQSTNEELQTTNEEIRQRTNELDEVNGFLESILTSLNVGVAVLDSDLRVRAWNRRADDLWGLRADEVEGKNFLNLELGLPVEQLRQSIRQAMIDDGGPAELTLPAVNRLGRSITCRITISRLNTLDGGRPAGVVVIFEESAPP
jgi:two-component system, chemotaxis family, CheB/CheR fusion protein